MVASLGAFDRLEPYTVKIVRAVLRGLGGSDAARLPGFLPLFLPLSSSAKASAIGIAASANKTQAIVDIFHLLVLVTFMIHSALLFVSYLV